MPHRRFLLRSLAYPLSSNISDVARVDYGRYGRINSELLLPDSDTAGELAESIRAEIFEKTECTASIGVGANKFLAKLGTDRVKPDGSYVVKEYRTLLESLKLRDLHGIGYRTESKLSAEGLETVRDVWDLGDQGEGELCRILGLGLGKKVFMYCKGKDDR
jgi:DNA repair protein REV1